MPSNFQSIPLETVIDRASRGASIINSKMISQAVVTDNQVVFDCPSGVSVHVDLASVILSFINPSLTIFMSAVGPINILDHDLLHLN